MAAIRARVVVSGRVQGVFFRVRTAETARSLGLSGWVRNRDDGSVEAVFEGEPDRVAAAIEWCRRGPVGAIVDGVDVSAESPEGESGFAIMP